MKMSSMSMFSAAVVLQKKLKHPAKRQSSWLWKLVNKRKEKKKRNIFPLNRR